MIHRNYADRLINRICSKGIMKKIAQLKLIKLIRQLWYSIKIKYYSIKYKSLIIRKYKHLIIRKGTTDIIVFDKVFIKKEYKLPFKIYPKLIIDGGANTGYASLWFANEYPDAQIIAVEPEESNFQVLKKNTLNYRSIRIIKAGLWNQNIFLKVLNRGEGKWGFVTEEAGSSDKSKIKAVTIDNILKKSGCNRIDILKLDIEGAEKEIFSSNYENWLDKVNILIIELHDRHKKGCSKTFYSAVKKYNFNEFRKGENIILVRKKSA